MQLYAVHARCALCWVTWAGQPCMEAPRSVQCPVAGALTGPCHARVCITLNPRIKPNAVNSVYYRVVTRRWTSSSIRAISDTAAAVAGLLAGLKGYNAQRACSRNWPHVSTGFRPKWSRASLSTVSRKRASVLPCSCAGAHTRALVCSHFLVSAYLETNSWCTSNGRSYFSAAELLMARCNIQAQTLCCPLTQRCASNVFCSLR